MSLDSVRREIWPLQEQRFLELLKGVRGSQELVEAVKYQVQNGGKRLRALLPVLVQEELGKDGKADGQRTTECALWSGLAVELLHAATLCHDDVMDGDRLRRDQPTVWVQYGVSQAINTGDLLFFLARDALHRAPFGDAEKLQALSTLSRKISDVIHGQAIEISLLRNKKLPEMSDYDEIARGKTGGLFSLCFALGALSLKTSTDVLEALDSVGSDLGWIFQVQDDILDLIGEKGRGSKGNDLWEGKPSWLVAACCSRLSEEERESFRRRLYTPRERKEVGDVEILCEIISESLVVEDGMRALEARAIRIQDKIQPELEPFRPLIDRFIDYFLGPLRVAFQANKSAR